MSPNVQDGGGAETPSRKRTLQDFLSAGKQSKLPNKPATPSKLRLVTDADDMVIDAKENTAAHTTDLPPDSPPDSPLSDISDMSDRPMSLMTDAGSNSSMPATPGKPGSDAGLPQLVVTIDGTPPAGSKLLSTAATSTTSSPSSTNGQPPAKRKKLTPAEREEKAKADLARKQEKEKAEAAKKLEKEKAEAARKLEKEKKEKAEAAKKQERDEQKALADAKKKAQADEKEKKRKQKEEEDQRKADEKEKKRREKEDEERKVQEAKNKKERSQLRLNSFFKTGNTSASASATSTTSTTPSTSNSAATSTSASGLLLTSPHKNASPSPVKASVSPQKGASAAVEGSASDAATTAAAVAEVSEYDRIFKPFFIKENVIMATHLYGMDDETKEAKSRILDEHLSGARGDFAPRKPFSSASAVDYFHLPCDKQQRPLPRGQSAATRPSVRKIMNAMHDSGYGAGSSNAQTKMALDLLKKVSMKYLFFREDVRPAYLGTITSQPPQARLSKLARNPLIKTVLPLNYDYDSEAEWVDDGDGEDVDDLDDDEEDMNDDDGEMSDFLDDSEEGGMPLRPAFSGGMEPDSTGICWENLESSSRRGALPRPELSNFRMEFILDHSGPIDPLSTKYWDEPEPVEAVESKAAPAKAAKAAKAASQPPATPADAFAALNGSVAAGTNATTAAATTAAPAPPADPKKAGVAAEFVPDLKKGILQYAKMTKLGIVEILSVEFVGKCTKAQIKNSIDALAERTGTGQHKTWKLKV